MEDWRNSLLDDYDGNYYRTTYDEWKEANKEELEMRREEAEEYLRDYYDDISWAKGKEEQMMYSVQMSDKEELELEWIRKGWMWYDKDEDEWMYSSQGHKARQENIAKNGLA